MKKHFLVILAFCSYALLSARDAELDSLLKILKTAPDDTNKLKLLEDIADIAPDGEWQKYSEGLGKLSEKFMGSSNASIKLAGKKYYSVYLNNKAYGFAEMGDYKNAFDFYDRCLKINQETDNKINSGIVLSSIGAIYERQNDSKSAIKYYALALKLQKETGNDKDMVATLVNIGVIYSKRNALDSALIFFTKALDIMQLRKYKNHNVVYLLSNFGTLMEQMQSPDKAIEYHQRALQMANEIGDKLGAARSLKGLARAYFVRGETARALAYAKQALTFAINTSTTNLVVESAELLKQIYKKQGNFKDALEMYQLEISNRDSLISNENQKASIQHHFKYEYDLKEATAKAEQEKKDSIARGELRRQKLVRNGFIGGFAVMVLFAGVFFRQRNKIGKEKKRSEDLLLNILPEQVAEELKEKGTADAKLFENVTVFFSDFKGFTTVSEKLSPQDLVNELHECFTAFDNIMHKYNIEKIKTVGDAYLAVSGLPAANPNHAEHMVKAALEIKEFMKTRNNKELSAVRMGVHSGHVVAGIVGVKKFAYDIWGDTVNTAARMEQNGEAGKVNISEATYELVKDKFTCEYRGEIQAKNKGKLKMYFVSEFV